MRLTHARLLVDDFGACFRFYRDVLGLEPTWGEEDGAYADFEGGGATLALFARHGMDGRAELRPPGDGAMLVFEVDDVDAVAARLGEHRVPLEAEPHDEPEWGIRVAHFRDPAGTLIEVNQPL
ncbi:MAG TPA: VOC family protein [Gaiellaceae bacterium]|nr:VOC family protein [Gaiellaceae bacterium]